MDTWSVNKELQTCSRESRLGIEGHCEGKMVMFSVRHEDYVGVFPRLHVMENAMIEVPVAPPAGFPEDLVPAGYELPINASQYERESFYLRGK